MTENELKNLKDKLFQLMFTTDLKGNVVIKDKYIQNILYSNYKKIIKKSTSKNTPFSEYVSLSYIHIYEALLKFKLPTDSDWYIMVDDYANNNFENINIHKMRKYINLTFTNKLIRELNYNTKYTKMNLNGVAHNVAMKMDVFSLDGYFNSDMQMDDVLTDDNNFITSNKKYNVNHFIEWFKENRKDVLTKSQNKLIDDLYELGYPEKSITPQMIYEYTGKNSSQLKSQYFKRISNKLYDAYTKEYGTKNKTIIDKYSNELNTFEQFKSLIDYDLSLKEQVNVLGDWLNCHLHIEYISNLITDNLKIVDLYNINNLHIIIFKVEERINELFDIIIDLKMKDKKMFREELNLNKKMLNNNVNIDLIKTVAIIINAYGNNIIINN